MELLILGSIFVVSMIALIKGADWVLDSSQKIGLTLGMSPFLVGVLIIGFGTSLPELVSSIFGMLSGATEIPVANAIGSNIANILLVVGLAAVFSKGVLTITKNLIDLEIPILSLVTLIFFGVAYDAVITTPESFFLLAAFVLYILYSFFQKDTSKKTSKTKRPKLSTKDFVLLIVGFVFLVGGAKYLIASVLEISEMIGISVGVITILAVAIGTSLPELIVSIKAVLAKNVEVSIGNIFGSNIFNLLLVVGGAGMLGTQNLDVATVSLALPMLLATTFFFVISGISNRIHVWEGAFYLLAYTLFIAKLFGWL
jgi:cation:H+ antiporter